MIFAILVPFLVGLFFFLLGNRGKRIAIVSVVLPLTLFIYFLTLLPYTENNESYVFQYKWISAMGIHPDFTLDGLSMLLSLMITGIGTLIFLYACNYLKGDPDLNRFLSYLCVFMGAMLGVVLSDNVIVLFVFWELTSISSFFLIGFDTANPEARRNSLMALAVTGGGGFLLLAGLILLSGISDTYSIRELSGMPDLLTTHEYYPLMLVLLFAGAFTKSAQFPFHFWLPGAMKAPTPVSAFLHSATMVKAGIYLLARLNPALGDHPYWTITLMCFGGFTMFYAALHAFIRTDLKAILAYSTISALGMLVFLIGMGTEAALFAAIVFMLVHALYKAALFLVTGAIDHTTGTRDVTRLGGLGSIMLPVAIAGTLAALSSAGVPFTFGFVGKELIYEAVLGFEHGQILIALVVITNILLLYVGFVAGLKPFTGKLLEEPLHEPPGFQLWLPPLVLAFLGVMTGIFPFIVDQPLVAPAVSAVSGTGEHAALKLWHGFNLVLLLSALTLVVGTALFLWKKPYEYRILRRLARFDMQKFALGISSILKSVSLYYTRKLQNGYLRNYLITIILFLVGVVSYKLFTEVEIRAVDEEWSTIGVYEILVSVLMLGAIIKVLTTPSRLTAIVSMGVVGFSICLTFFFYGAPDLAMTQFTIDTLTIVLFVLVLLKLPSFIPDAHFTVKLRDGILAIAFGGLISVIGLQVLNEPTSKEISQYYADNAYLLAKGKNIVNVILVDFRGLDTLIEITVLTIAAVGVFSLLKLRPQPKEKE